MINQPHAKGVKASNSDNSLIFIKPSKDKDESILYKIEKNLVEPDMENTVYLTAKSISSQFQVEPLNDSFSERNRKESVEKMYFYHTDRVRRPSNLDNLFDKFIRKNIKIKQIQGDNYLLPEFDESVFMIKTSNSFNLTQSVMTFAPKNTILKEDDEMLPEERFYKDFKEREITYSKNELPDLEDFEKIKIKDTENIIKHVEEKKKKKYYIKCADNAMIKVPSDCKYINLT
jgi:hypothetical protein